MQKKQLWFILLVAAILTGGLLLRLSGVTDETRITWDEHRPDIEKFFERPVSFMTYEMEHTGLYSLSLENRKTKPQYCGFDKHVV